MLVLTLDSSVYLSTPIHWHFMTVVDPTIWLGWISDHWEQSAATKAWEDILELVCFLTIHLLNTCWPWLKMTMYHNSFSTQAVPLTTESSTTNATSQVRPHSTLAARYCSLPTIRVQSSQPAPQGVDQEFNAYTLATPSPEGTHPLSFWEVGPNPMICISLIVSHFT